MPIRAPASTSAALGAVLAGGRGSRIGGAKALVELDSRPLVGHAVAALREAGLEAVVVAKPGSELPPLACEVVRERPLPIHPIAGILTALDAARGRPIVALACDMPFVPPALLAHLALLEAHVAVPMLDGRLEPGVARFEVSAAAALRRALHREEPLREAIGSLDPAVVDEAELGRFGDPRRILLNVNTSGDLRLAEAGLQPSERALP
ncbi:MAG TPA: molybdenum cofactor guanylyltransferase [Solirubrobacterales bacterium]|nr:molybdenum cofactor guanylyltransferase [Solirubrobacterales bacterium]